MAGIYLHIPFCKQKCIYCDFYSVVDHSLMEDFISSMKKEILLYKDCTYVEEFDTIYIGGGTPSLLPPKAIHEFITILHGTFSIKENAEITIEANPGTIDRFKLIEYRKCGINRLSIGVQSFNLQDLQFLGRIHTPEEARQSVRDAYVSGFSNISIDLLYALPQQAIYQLVSNLREAVNLGVQHISAYSLIVEEETPLGQMVAKKQVIPSMPETDASMFEFASQYLEVYGFLHYEVSNYAKPGFQSQHNLNYWKHGNYIGFGPSAHSFWNSKRWWNIDNINVYCNKLSKGEFPINDYELLDHEKLLEEYVMLGLRSGGIDLNKIKSQWNVDIYSKYSQFIAQMLQEKLATFENSILKLTRNGYLLCNEITERILT